MWFYLKYKQILINFISWRIYNIYFVTLVRVFLWQEKLMKCLMHSKM